LIKLQKLEDLIHEKIPLGVADSRGFFSLKCQVCNDYKVRAGFKFDLGNIGYNCWNCSTTGKYEEFSGRISKNFRKILNAYGIDDSEISAVVNTTFFVKKEKEDTKITLAKLTKVNTTTPTIKLPLKSFPLGHPEFVDYQQKLVTYLIDRKVDLDKYKFFFSLEPRFLNRIIIPFYRGANIIYWQARHIDNVEKKRYDNAPVGRDAVMYNFDQLNSYATAPLFITEGVFDAMMVNGVAILGSKLNDAKTELLAKTGRRLVFVIDKDKNGKHLAEDVLSKGWEIAFAPDGSEDLNQSVCSFGLSYTIYELMKSITKDNDPARLSINRYCR
jgi:hypothetical protein